MNNGRQLKVAINVQIAPRINGGIAPFVASLIYALGRLEDGRESYTIIVRDQEQVDWLRPYLGSNQSFAIRTPASNRHGYVHEKNGDISFTTLLKRSLGPLLPAARYLQKLINKQHEWPETPISDGYYESLGCDIIHFASQGFTLCALPCIYNPHDLQHLHLPQFWPPSTIADRETVYQSGCHFARTVIVGSQWIKDDVVRQYRIHPDKVQVIPEAPPLQLQVEPTQESLDGVKKRYHLEQPFALFPAVTWPHKNHLRLLEALAHLRDSRGLTIRLVCTGSKDEAFWPQIEKCLDKYALRSQVKFLGFVSDAELRALHRLSQFLVMPTLFEAISLPIFDAWAETVPVVCSNVTALPDQVLDAATLFDPYSVESIADALARVATDEKLRVDLGKRGARRVKDFDWTRTAKAYRAVYRRATSNLLTEEDHWLLGWDWMREPKRGLARPGNANCRL